MTAVPPMALTPSLPGAERVHVGFTDSVRRPWLRCLKPGFRHCLAIVEGAGWWLTVDPLASHLYLAVTRPDPQAGPARRLLENGFAVAVLPAPQSPAVPAPCAPLTCVEVIKRLVGVHAPVVATPWALYRRLAAAGAATARPSDPPEKIEEACHGCWRC